MSENHLVTCNHILNGVQHAETITLSWQPDKSTDSLNVTLRVLYKLAFGFA